MFIGGTYYTDILFLDILEVKSRLLTQIMLNFFYFLLFSAVSKEGQTAPRTGFFHDFRPKEVIAKRYNQVKETFEDILDEEEVRRLEINLKDFDRNLGAYPYDSWKKWVSLTNKISTATIKR